MWRRRPRTRRMIEALQVACERSGTNRGRLIMSGSRRWMVALSLLAAAVLLGHAGTAPAAAQAAAPADCKGPLRKINVGVSVSPPNVVHTTPYIAKELGIFAKHCIDANIIQFDGGESPAATAAISQGSAISNVNDVAIGRGMKAKQLWGLAPRPPQVYAVGENIKTAADLKGKRLSAAGG